MRKLILFTCFIMIFSLIGCTNQSENQNSTDNPDKTEKLNQEGESDEKESNENVKEIDMTAKQFEFQPSTITVQKGQKLILNVKSTDVEHGIAIPEFGIDKVLKPGKEVTVEFTPDKKGDFEFLCSVYCGKGHKSMKGTLIVK